MKTRAAKNVETVFRQKTRDGYLSINDLNAVKKSIRADGKTTASERRTLDRLVGQFRDTWDDGSARINTHFGAHAREGYNQFRTTGLGDAVSGYSQPLPSTTIDSGNRLGTGRDARGELYPLRRGTQLVDGASGRPRGTVTDPSVKLNFGQKKFINGKEHVYAFSAGAVVKGKHVGVSGWVPLEAVQGARPRTMGDVRAPQAPLDLSQPLRITGASDRYGKAAYVVPPQPGEGNQAPRDYLTRPTGVVNLLYALPGRGGVSNDTVGINQAGVRFFKATTVPPVDIPLFNKDGSKNGQTMRFVYGAVEGTDGQRRFGWIGAENLAR
jgi:hypothetical protein